METLQFFSVASLGTVSKPSFGLGVNYRLNEGFPVESNHERLGENSASKQSLSIIICFSHSLTSALMGESN